MSDQGSKCTYRSDLRVIRAPSALTGVTHL